MDGYAERRARIFAVPMLQSPEVDPPLPLDRVHPMTMGARYIEDFLACIGAGGAYCVWVSAMGQHEWRFLGSGQPSEASEGILLRDSERCKS